MAWLVSDARVLASAQVADDPCVPTARAAQTGQVRRRARDRAVPLDPHHRHALPDRRRLPRRRRRRSSRPSRCTVIGSGIPVGRARSVIEAEAGAFARWGLRVGDVVEVRRDDETAAARRMSTVWLVATPIGNLGDLRAAGRRDPAPRQADLLRGHPPHRSAPPTRRHQGAATRRVQRPHRTRPDRRRARGAGLRRRGGDRQRRRHAGDLRSRRADRAGRDRRRPHRERDPRAERGDHGA